MGRIEDIVSEISREDGVVASHLRDVPNVLIGSKTIKAQLIAFRKYLYAALTSHGSLGQQHLIQSDTGTGKTVAYSAALIIAYLLTGKQCIIATHRIKLRKQILDDMEKYVRPLIRDFIMEYDGQFDLHPILCEHFASEYMSYASFVSDKKEKELLDENKLDENYINWMKTRTTLLLCDYTDDFDLPDGVLETDLVMETGKYDANRKKRKEYNDESLRSPILIVTHALIAVEIGAFYQILFRNGHNYGTVLVDEAENLPDIVTNKSDITLTVKKLSDMLKEVAGDRRGMLKLKKMITEEYLEFPKRNMGFEQPRAMQIISSLKEIRTRVSKFSIPDAHKECFSHLVQMVEYLCKPDVMSGVINYAFVDGDVVGISSSNSLAMSGIRVLYNEGISSIFTSACITDPRKLRDLELNEKSKFLDDAEIIKPFQAMAYSLFIRKDQLKVENCCAVPIDDFGSPKFMIHHECNARNLPKPVVKFGENDYRTNPEHLRMCKKIIKSAMKYHGGRALICVTSYADLRSYEIYFQNLGYHVVCQQPGNSQSISDIEADFIKFGESNNSDIIGIVVDWAGINIRGLLNVIIPRLKYDPPDASMDHLYTLKRGYRADYAIFAKHLRCLKQLKQAIGRGVRDHNDSPNIWLCDPRITNSSMYARCTRYNFAECSSYISLTSDDSIGEPDFAVIPKKIVNSRFK